MHLYVRFPRFPNYIFVLNENIDTRKIILLQVSKALSKYRPESNFVVSNNYVENSSMMQHQVLKF